jgi:hypothetical protein
VSALDDLADEQRWVSWRNELRGDKLTKVPYGAGGKLAKADDPATWITITLSLTPIPPTLIPNHEGRTRERKRKTTDFTDYTNRRRPVPG